MRFSELTVEMLGHCCNSPDEVTLGLRVGYAVVTNGTREPHFQFAIFHGNVRVFDQIVAEQKPVPVLEVGLDHMDVMGPDSAVISLDKPGVERRCVVSPRWPPEVLIPLCFQGRDNPLLGLIKTRHFDQNIDNGFGREAGNSGAAKMFNPFDQIMRQAR